METERNHQGLQVLVHAKSLQSCPTAALWTVAHQASLSMGFSRQEYWSELPFPPPGDLPNPGIELLPLRWQAGSLLPVPPLVSHWFLNCTLQYLLLSLLCTH